MGNSQCAPADAKAQANKNTQSSTAATGTQPQQQGGDEKKDTTTNATNNTTLSSSSRMYNAIVIGASGSVGSCLVRSLIASNRWNHIHLLNRKNISEFDKNSKITQHEMKMASFEEETTSLLTSKDLNITENPIDCAFITMGVGAPSKVDYETLYKVDVTLPTQFAQACVNNGVRHVSLLTAVGADISKKKDWLGTSAVSGYYCHCKGQVEHNVSTMGFKSVGLFRPSTLFGSTNTPSSAEIITPMVSWALPKKYEGINVNDLGKAMMYHAQSCLDEYSNGSGDDGKDKGNDKENDKDKDSGNKNEEEKGDSKESVDAKESEKAKETGNEKENEKEKTKEKEIIESRVDIVQGHSLFNWINNNEVIEKKK